MKAAACSALCMKIRLSAIEGIFNNSASRTVKVKGEQCLVVQL